VSRKREKKTDRPHDFAETNAKRSSENLSAEVNRGAVKGEKKEHDENFEDIVF